MKIHLAEIIGPLWGASELCLALVKRSTSDATTKDRHSLKVIWIVNLTAIALGIIAAYRLPSCQLPWPKVWLRLGVCLFFLGIALRWYAIVYLGRFFTVNVAISPDHRVIDSGPYRYVRHPSYAGATLVIIGFSLTMQNWAAFLLIVVPCFVVQLWRIHIEEKALLGALGDAYRNYMQRTKRLVPLLY